MKHISDEHELITDQLIQDLTQDACKADGSVVSQCLLAALLWMETTTAIFHVSGKTPGREIH